jgi:hypothetical protein
MKNLEDQLSNSEELSSGSVSREGLKTVESENELLTNKT